MPKKFHNKRPRNKSNKNASQEAIWVFGLHAVEACFAMQPENIIDVLYARQTDDYMALIDEMKSIGLPVRLVENDVIDTAVGPSMRHQSIAVKLKQNRSYNEADLFAIIEKKQGEGQPVMLLILDGVTDPRNLGACLRCANGAGVDAVVVPKDNASSITAITRKTASGAAETTPFVQVTNLSRTIKKLQEQGLWIVGTSDRADYELYEQTFDRDMAFVLGSEDKGIRPLTAKNCDELISIPMQGSVNSLNVSVATAVCLYEALRQRSQ